jgi:hypothetical protein
MKHHTQKHTIEKARACEIFGNANPELSNFSFARRENNSRVDDNYF